MSPLDMDGREENIMGRTLSAEARLTAAEFRLGDRSKRWEARQTPCVPRALSDQETTPPAQAWRAYGDLKSVRNVADREARGRGRGRMLITGEQA
jgi:hypothetical protein